MTTETKRAELNLLRVALAKAQGYKIELVPPAFTDSIIVGVYDPDGLCVHTSRGERKAHSLEEWHAIAWRNAFMLGRIPDWSRDGGAALALCLEVRNRLNAQADAGQWALIFSTEDGQNTVGLLYRCNGEDIHAYTAQGHNARAMSDVALAALEGGGGC